MLPESYKKALAALQDQAKAAMTMTSDKEAGKAALADAQRQMAEHVAECKQIVRLVMKSTDPDLSIPKLTEERLGVLLGVTHSCHKEIVL